MKEKQSPKKSEQELKQNEIKKAFSPWKTPSLLFVGKLKDIVLNNGATLSPDNPQQPSHTGRL